MAHDNALPHLWLDSGNRSWTGHRAFLYQGAMNSALTPLQTVRGSRNPRGFRLVACAAAGLLLAACASNDPASRLARAQDAIASADFGRANVELRNVLQEDPENAEARLLLGLTLLEMGDATGAERELGQAAALGIPLERVGIERARASMQAGRIDAAMAVLEQFPNDLRDASWFSVKGYAEFAGGRAAAAREAFQRARALDPARHDVLLGLAEVNQRLGEPDAAYDAVTRAIETAPESADAYALRGRLDLTARNVAAAEQGFARAAQLYARNAAASGAELSNLFMLAQVQLALGRAEALAETAELAAERAADSPIAAYATGALHFVNRRHAEASAALQRALNAAPTEMAIRSLLGASSLEAGLLGQAEQHLLAVLEQRPGDVTTARLLAETRRRQRRPESALTTIEALPGADTDPALIAYRGTLHLEMGRSEQAVHLLERAAAARGNDVSTLLQLARAYIAEGRRDDAAELFAASLGSGTDAAVEHAAVLLDRAYAEANADRSPLEQAEELVAELGDAQSMLGAALYLQVSGRSTEARAMLERAMEREPGLIAVRLVMSALALAEGRADEARRGYEQILAEDRDNIQAHLGLVRTAVAVEATDEALRFALRAAELAPRDPAVLLVAARLQLATGDDVGAADTIEAALAQDATHADIRTLAAEVALRQDQPERALDHLLKATEAEPGRADRWYQLGRLQRALGDLEAARDSLGRSVVLAANHPNVLVELAYVELEAGDPVAARAVAQQLQSAFPGRAEGYLVEGGLLGDSGNYVRAAALFDQAFARSPSYEAALGAYRARRDGRQENPTEPLRRWLEVTPDDGRAWLLIGDHENALGRSREALMAYEQVLARQPDSVVALNNAAWLYGKAGDPRGLDYASRAIALAPRLAPVLDTYGWLLLENGEVAEALQVLRQAATAAPGVHEIQLHYASALISNGDHTDARQVIERVLAESETPEVRANAEAALREIRQ